MPKQPWYGGGYRANIVAFAFARLARLIQEEMDGSALNVPAIWRGQAVSPTFEAQLVAIAKAVFDVIVAPEAGIQNVTEWCKKELCTQRALAVPVDVVAGFEDELAEGDEERARLREGREGARIAAGLEATTAVLEYGAENWRRVRDWARGKSSVSPVEDRLLSLVCGAGRIPNPRQSGELLGILSRLEGEGFSR